MSETNIFRPATDVEKQDFVEVGQTNILDVFMAKLAEVQQEFGKKFRPFDKYSARMDFDEKVKKTIGDISSSMDNAKARKLEIGDLHEYGNPDRFELISTRPVYEDKLLDGIRNTVIVGKEFRFKAKQRGNPITVYVAEIDLPEVDKYITETYGKK